MLALSLLPLVASFVAPSARLAAVKPRTSAISAVTAVGRQTSPFTYEGFSSTNMFETDRYMIDDRYLSGMGVSRGRYGGHGYNGMGAYSMGGYGMGGYGMGGYGGMGRYGGMGGYGMGRYGGMGGYGMGGYGGMGGMGRYGGMGGYGMGRYGGMGGYGAY